MSRSYPNRQSTRDRDHNYWQQIVENRLPLVGPWFREVAATRLAQLAIGGNVEAARSLTKAYCVNPDGRVKEIAEDALLNLAHPSTWNAVWEIWAANRSPELEALLLERKQSASNPPLVRVLSQIKLQKSHLLNRANGDLASALLEASEDQDPEIAEQAQATLERLTYSEGIEVVCAAWVHERKPWLETIIESSTYMPADPTLRVLVLLKRGQPEVVLQGGAEIVLPLVQCGMDPDPEIVELADFCLHHLSKQDAIDEFCSIWSVNRMPFLERILLQNGWIATKPYPVRLLTALKTGRLEIAQKVPAAQLDALLKALEDSDPAIRSRAREAINNLESTQTIDALCQRVIDQDQPDLRKLALEAGYQPSQTEQRALFLFLTAQWDAYASLDFDQRILRAIFTAAPPDLRKRISRALQASGRTDFLSILAGVDFRSQSHELTREDTQILVNMLIESQSWDRLWLVAQELPLAWIMQIVEQLLNAGWQPENGDLPLFKTLAMHTKEEITLQPNLARQALPLAIPIETLNVHGRVNSIAFSPSQPLLAVGTGQRKVVLWNYQRGAIEQILGPFDHSIGQVDFNSRGDLFFAERANPDCPCSVYVWMSGEVSRVGGHTLSINALCPVGEHQVATAGNDRRIFLWDVDRGELVSQAILPSWASKPRELIVSESGQSLAILHENISFLNLPNLDQYQEFYRSFNKSALIQKSTARCAAFLPGNGDLAVGQFNGQVIWYHGEPGKSYRDKYLLAYHTKTVQGVTFLANRSILISGGSEGELKFIPWPDRRPIESLSVPAGSLTSLQTSPDGNKLATGCGNSKLVLWDLRVMDLPALLARPLAHAKPDDLVLVNAFYARDAVPEPVRNALLCLQALLQHRYRYDIELAEQPAILPGEFDIILDETPLKNEYNTEV